MTTAITYSLIMFGIAFVLSMGVALLMKVIFKLVQYFNAERGD